MSKENQLVIGERAVEPLMARRVLQAEKPSPHVLANWPEMIAQAISRPNGARYYRCALQVNSPLQDRFKGFDSRHRRHSAAYQHDYALSLARACKRIGIDVIGLCDHNSVAYLKTIRDELNEEGIIVFPGFEIASTEGIHLLCLFNPDADIEDLDHLLTELGLPPKDRWTNSEGLAPRQSPLAFPRILERVQRHREGICIAAHVDRENGLLYECAKTTRVQYFTDQNLLAAQIAGRREDLMEFYRKVVDNELEHYRRQKEIALLNCLDVYNLKDLDKPECSTWIKMSSPSVEGLWQAFLDPQSRLRLLSEETPKPHAELVAMAWEGGFLSGSTIHFNENLNCLIGGRGTGKSTLIESLRYVLGLQPAGEDIQKRHESILREVLRSGTHISLLVRSHRPSPRYYLIERTYPGKPVVRDESGNVLGMHPNEIFSGVEIFGQHEIAEIARDQSKQYRLIHRFRDPEVAELEARKEEIRHQLETNRIDLLRTQKEIEAVEEKLSRLPAVEEKLRRYQDFGIEKKLKEQSLLAREESLLKMSREKFPAIKKAIEQLRQVLAFDYTFLNAEAVTELPNADLWAKLRRTIEKFQEEMEQTADNAASVIQETETTLWEIAEIWEARRQKKRGAYEKILRELQKESIDGEIFMKLRREYEMLVPLKNERRKLEQKNRDLEKQRRHLLQEWEEIKANIFKFDQAAAAKISQLLAGRVRAQVIKEHDLTPLLDLLKKYTKGLKFKAIQECLQEQHLISLADFVQHVREGNETLRDIYEFNERTAAAIAGLPSKAVYEMEELELLTSINLELNVAEKNQEPVWKALQELSIGQKATAILQLLLSESDMPLVIDQPEDDLDNRFIAEGIIPTLRQEKGRRQFLFATHNANLPVLGDAELIIGLEASGDNQTGAVQIRDDHLGSIDLASVKLLVEQILEGGKQAFETRRVKYGF
ncbi:MAG: AAA family ATPase [candidate division KSB1 bacterium]|nr:AAA family ATPase [candidate division KSB1 bacterium]MDZ7305358.1 AAA family ATPase [candidate division KSB1 bacterium]